MRNLLNPLSRLAGLAAAVTALTLSLSAQEPSSLAGKWSGTIWIPGSPLDVVVTITPGSPTPAGTIDIPAQGARALPLENITASAADVSFVIAGIPGRPTFTGTLEGDSITGTFTQSGAGFRFALARVRSDASAAGSTATVDSIRAFMRAALTQWNVPGAAVVVIKDGEVILSEGFGMRDVESRLPLTARTLLPIGSSTKAFTAFIIGTLVDDGLVDWDDPVQKHLPDFRLSDPEAARSLRVRDLLTHTSGLPRHDLLWYGSTSSRQNLFKALEHLESNTPVRTRWQYQNLMYMTAGVLAERLTGRSWEQLVDERILRPLGMNSTVTSIGALRQFGERAIGYERKEGVNRPMPYRDIDAVGPAGSIASTGEDMARWVLLQLNHGRDGERALITRSSLERLHAPQVVMPSPAGVPPGTLLFSLYAMGWMEHAFRGYRLLEHGGNIDGFSALVSFMPEKNLGVVVLTNMNGTGLPNAAMLTIYDHLLGQSGTDWSGLTLSRVGAVDSLGTQSREASEALRVRGTRPSHELAEYVATYEHPAYGPLQVVLNGRELGVTLRGMTARLEHYHYDVFQLVGSDLPIDGMKVEFRTATTGEIASAVIPLEPSVAPIVFERAAASAVDSLAALPFTGDYEVAGVTVGVRWQAGELIVSVTGQEDRVLQPFVGRTFRLKGLEGYMARFLPDRGRADQIVFIQPNGVFPARRAR